MSIAGYFRPWTSNTKNVWDYVFDLTPAHPSLATIKILRNNYDVLGDKAFTVLSDLRKAGRSRGQGNIDQEQQQLDLFTLLQENWQSNPTLSELWTTVSNVPAWVSWEQIARGQDCFHRYGIPLSLGLAFESLLAGMGAARIVEVLSRTGGFQTNVARRRILETTQFVLQCTESLKSLQPGGRAFASCLRVRFLHAAVRQKMTTLSLRDSTYWDSEAFGVPINDLDSIATVSSFSSTLIWVALPRQGYVSLGSILYL